MPYEVVRNQDGTITFRDIVYESKRYISNAALNKVNIEGHVYDMLLSPYTQEITLIEEHPRASTHVNDGKMRIGDTTFYVTENSDGSFMLSDKLDMTDPDAAIFPISNLGAPKYPGRSPWAAMFTTPTSW